ncbi:MAG: ABC transporter substrate-binding protein/permease [Bacteroidetes bacterium]|nr:ABC transporter permease subunit [Bacteroidota bacterium]MCZ2133295.1 ABC transporter substrate-binding protein/permease [Bacteroidota bacterium]
MNISTVFYFSIRLALLTAIFLIFADRTIYAQGSANQSGNNGLNISTLRYGADASSGAPYCFADRKDLSRLKGFDVEVIEAIAEQLHLQIEHVQNTWDGLIPGLERNTYDVVIDGVAITPEHQEGALFSAPYYFSSYSLVVRNADATVNSLNDFKGYNNKIGTLTGSEALDYLNKVGGFNIKQYDQEIDGYQDLMLGRIDGFIIDAPVAMYYVPAIKGLRIVEQPIDTIRYGIAVAKGNVKLIEQINEAIFSLQRSGKLRKILERWNLWNDAMADYLDDHRPMITPPTEYDEYLDSLEPKLTWRERAERYLSFMPLFAKAAGMTMTVSISSMGLAMFWGLILAVMRIYGPSPVRYAAITYIEVIRGTPLLIQLLIIFYGLPSVGIAFSPFIAGWLGLGLNYAASEAENYRAGILAIPKGQSEAAIALGMTRWQTLRHVTLPQAVRIVMPPVTNDFIALIKDSSLVSMITLTELTQTYTGLRTTYFDEYFGIGIQVAIIYLMIGLPFVYLSRWMERRLHGFFGTKR